MTYPNIRPGVFLSRPNRFIAHVKVDGVLEVCHVKNTGRCRELLVPGAQVWLVESDNPERKTRYDLVAAEKERSEGKLLVNMAKSSTASFKDLYIISYSERSPPSLTRPTASLPA